MFCKTHILISAVLVIGQAAASVLLTADQNCGEKGGLICYGAPAGVSQNVDPADVAYIAGYLRFYGRSTTPPAMLTIPATSPYECAEWSLYVAGTAMALGKHINPRVNSTVLFEDIANTIDGGENATIDQITKSISSCSKNGGSVAVTVDKTRPEYNTDDFKKSGASTDGIIIKIVAAPK